VGHLAVETVVETAPIASFRTGYGDTVADWAQGRGFIRDSGHEIGTLHVEKYR
jgi:glycerol dehydrogenase-like iron-containing ADH family enzyme